MSAPKTEAPNVEVIAVATSAEQSPDINATGSEHNEATECIRGKISSKYPKTKCGGGQKIVVCNACISCDPCVQSCGYQYFKVPQCECGAESSYLCVYFNGVKPQLAPCAQGNNKTRQAVVTQRCGAAAAAGDETKHTAVEVCCMQCPPKDPCAPQTAGDTVCCMKAECTSAKGCFKACQPCDDPCPVKCDPEPTEPCPPPKCQPCTPPKCQRCPPPECQPCPPPKCPPCPPKSKPPCPPPACKPCPPPCPPPACKPCPPPCPPPACKPCPPPCPPPACQPCYPPCMLPPGCQPCPPSGPPKETSSMWPLRHSM